MNKRGEDGIGTSGKMIMLVIVIVVSVVVFVSNPLKAYGSSVTSCEDAGGALMINDCNSALSEGVYPKATANSKTDDGKTLFCCVPTKDLSKEDFQKWVDKNGGSNEGSIAIDGTVNFQIDRDPNLLEEKDPTVIVPSRNSLANVYVGENITLYAVKKIEQGKYCSLTVYGLKEFTGEISREEESVYTVDSTDCEVDTTLVLEDIKLTYRELEQGYQGEGLYEVEMLVFEKKTSDNPLTSWKYNIQLMDKS